MINANPLQLYHSPRAKFLAFNYKYSKTITCKIMNHLSEFTLPHQWAVFLCAIMWYEYENVFAHMSQLKRLTCV